MNKYPPQYPPQYPPNPIDGQVFSGFDGYASQWNGWAWIRVEHPSDRRLSPMPMEEG